MSVIVNSVLILFALVFLGYYVGKTKMVRVECAPDLSKLLVNILLPLTVFKSMIRPFNESLIKDGALLFILVVIFHGFELIIGLLVTRSLKIEYTRKGVWLFVCLFPNNGFIGFPLAASIYGDDGLFLMAIANVVTNFLIFSLGFWVLTRNGSASHKISLKQMIVNNINLAVVLGLFFYLTQIPLPETLYR